MSPIGTVQELREIIRCNTISSVFQPIMDLRNAALFGYEALTRGPVNSLLHSPTNLFETAQRHGMMAPLEFACSENACKRFAKFGAEGKLFLNVSPISLVEKKYQQQMSNQVIREFGLSPERVVIELSEQYPLNDYVLMRRATDYFRDLGFEVAIDDLGAGYAGLRAWSELRPDYVKVDRHFIEQINEDPVKREFLRSIMDIANEMDCKVVAEGIETPDQLSTVQAMGVHYGQGYFLGRPEAVPTPSHLLTDRVTQISTSIRQPLRRSQTVAELAVSTPAIEPWVSLDEVVEIFQCNRGLSCLPVVEDGQALGLIQRQEMLELYTARYSRELYGKKPARAFVDPASVVVADDRSLEEVSRLLTGAGDQLLSQNFIITRDNKFYGIGKTSALLRRITEQQIRNARYANPLTLLPGNVPIHEMLDELLARHESFRVAYCDVDHFKPYNDCYGYSKGDEVIVRLANIAQSVVDYECDFVGHIGGDDFMLIMRCADWEERLQRMLDLFESSQQDFYCADAYARGGIQARSRSGDIDFFPLLSVSIGVVHPDASHCFSHHDISSLVADAKLRAKQQPGNSIFVSRRRRPQAEVEVKIQGGAVA